jgi:UDP-2,3-diacylglucosamine hydrolase
VIAIAAGAGNLPVEACKKLLFEGRSFFIISFFPKNNLVQLKKIVQEKIPIIMSSYYKAGEVLELVKNRGAKQVLLIGKFDKKELLKKVKFDWFGVKILGSLLCKGDAHIMEEIVRLLEKHGLKVLNQDDVLGPLKVPPEILIGKISPSLESNIRLGIKTALDLSKNDIGQTVVVKDQMILAVEAIEGTDRCVRRGIELGGGDVVICKAAHLAQNKKFDLPTLGPLSLENLKKGNVKAIAWLSTHTLIAQRKLFIERAGELGIVLISVGEGDFFG